ncbi:MAG: aspartate carbamoyltransferase regulatory subunit [Parachlamydiaceae bacterium]
MKLAEIIQEAGTLELTKSHSVASIEHGTVIDHILPGKAILLLRLLKLENHHNQITIGLNLPSGRMKTKDLIKVSGWELTPKETSQIAVFSLGTTINIISNYQVVKKIPVILPETIEDILVCPNANCITHKESTSRRFLVKSHRKEIQMECSFCERCVYLNEITGYIL